MRDAIRVALLLGSTREGRLCDTVANWAGEQVWRRNAFRLDFVDPAALDLPVRLEREAGSAVTALRQRLAAADAFIIVTPEYNHGYPAALKSVIDATGPAWRAKPVGFVSYGGRSGGLRAVEQLRQVFAELHAVSLRDGVSFEQAGSRFDADGTLRAPDEPESAMAALLGHLHWWAVALRNARRERPYEQLAA